MNENPIKFIWCIFACLIFWNHKLNTKISKKREMVDHKTFIQKGLYLHKSLV